MNNGKIMKKKVQRNYLEMLIQGKTKEQKYFEKHFQTQQQHSLLNEKTTGAQVHSQKKKIHEGIAGNDNDIILFRKCSHC